MRDAPDDDNGDPIRGSGIGVRTRSVACVVRVVRTPHSLVKARKALEGIVLGSVAITTRALATVGVELTFAQWRVLVIAGESPRGATVTEIATRTGAELSPASRLVSRMAQRGLVTLQKDYRDRRVTRVTATDEGRKLRKAVLAWRRELLTDVLAIAGPIEPEVEAAMERIGLAFRRYS